MTGPAILEEGFRPFFLAAGLWAVTSLLLWLGALRGSFPLASEFDPLTWHAHELVFGFALAAVAGFLLTAIPNWTGRMPLQGAPLALLVLAWAAGRVAVAGSSLIGAGPAALIDLSFTAAMLSVVLREVVAGRNWRNLPMAGALTLLLAANALVHAEALGWTTTASLGNRAGVAVLVMLISLVGGRIIPSFTRNWLVKRKVERLPASFGAIDRLALLATAAALMLWIAGAPDGPTGIVLLAAGALASLRLGRWQGLRVLREPLLWILHLGHLWLAAGLVLLGAARLWGAIPESAGLHALTAGAIGTMTLAVMTRAARGHTGRPLTSDAATTSAYLLVTAGAALRVASGLLLPETGATLLSFAGIAWIAAFATFVVAYARPLTMPRLRASDCAAPG
jgi:uncharacterized protein involved in response to NO